MRQSPEWRERSLKKREKTYKAAEAEHLGRGGGLLPTTKKPLETAFFQENV